MRQLIVAVLGERFLTDPVIWISLGLRTFRDRTLVAVGVFEL